MMKFIYIISTALITSIWIFICLNYILPFVMQYTSSLNVVIHIILLLVIVGPLVKANEQLGLEYNKILNGNLNYNEVKLTSLITMVASISIILYIMYLVWFDGSLIRSPEFNHILSCKIILTIFAASSLSIAVKISE